MVITREDRMLIKV